MLLIETMKNKIIIYQVLPRLYGNQKGQNKRNGSIQDNGCGKLNDFTSARLKKFAANGYTHIWYTGIIEHATKTDYSAYGIAKDNEMVVKGQAGSPYAIKDYYDVSPDLASKPELRMQEFEALIQRTHAAGLKAIIDFVPNHVARQYHSDVCPKGVRDLGVDDNTAQAFSPNNNFYYIPGQELKIDGVNALYGEPYIEKPAKVTGNDQFSAYVSRNDWYETVKLNYGVDYMGGRRNCFQPLPNTWHKMLEILLFWASKGIDGFRCDMAEMVPCEFWEWAVPQVKKRHKGIILIAEVYNPALYRDYIYKGHFDYLYDKVGLYDKLRAIVSGYSSASEITQCWQGNNDILSHLLNFLENHDEQRLASDFYAGDAQKGLPALVASLCMNTNPFMVYAGQEIGEKGLDEEGFSGRDGRTTIYDYWCVDSLQKLLKGKSAMNAEEVKLYDSYTRLLKLANSSSAISKGAFFDLMYVNNVPSHGFNPNRMYCFLRQWEKELLLVVCNFDKEESHCGIFLPSHAFDYLKIPAGKYKATDKMNGKKTSVVLEPDTYLELDVSGYNATLLQIGID